VDTARRIAYQLNEKQEIELWLWPGLDVAPGTLPLRYPVPGEIPAEVAAEVRALLEGRVKR